MQDFAMWRTKKLSFVRFCYVKDQKAMICKILLCKGPKSYVLQDFAILRTKKLFFCKILLYEGQKSYVLQDFAMWRTEKLGFVGWRKATYVLHLAKSLLREASYALHLTNSHLRKATYVLPRKVTSVLIKEWLCFLSMIQYLFRNIHILDALIVMLYSYRQTDEQVYQI